MTSSHASTEEFTLSEEEKISIIDQVFLEICESCYPLHISRNYDQIPLNAKPNQNDYGKNTFTYNVYGNDFVRKTQTANLATKIMELNKQAESNTLGLIEEIEESSSIQREDGQNFRYFNDNVRCFRCKKTGHCNYACLDEFSCLYCLSPQHNTQKCNQKFVCFHCYQPGHISNECSGPSGPYCQDCRRKHAGRCGFLTKGNEPTKQMFNTQYLYNHENTRCMKCFEYGHMVCHGENLLPKEN